MKRKILRMSTIFLTKIFDENIHQYKVIENALPPELEQGSEYPIIEPILSFNYGKI